MVTIVKIVENKVENLGKVGNVSIGVRKHDVAIVLDPVPGGRNCGGEYLEVPRLGRKAFRNVLRRNVFVILRIYKSRLLLNIKANVVQ